MEIGFRLLSLEYRKKEEIGIEEMRDWTCI